MSVNLLEMLQGVIVQQLGPISNILGASEDEARSAIGKAIPVLFGGLVHRFSSHDNGLPLLEKIQQADGSLVDQLGNQLSAEEPTALLSQGNSILQTLFGERLAGITQSLGSMTSLDGDGVTKLLELLAPVLLSVIGKQQARGGLGADGIKELVLSQKDHLSHTLPAGLGDMLGLANLGGTGATAAGQAGTSAAVVDEARRRVSQQPSVLGAVVKFIPVILILLLALVMWRLFGTSNEPVDPEPYPDEIGEVEDLELEITMPDEEEETKQ